MLTKVYIKIMGTVLLQFGLTALNLVVAKSMEAQNRNPRLQYFIAGITCGLGISALIRLFIK